MLEIKDNEIFNIIQGELSRQQSSIELIASENYASIEIMKAQGSVLTNKYAEGYPGKRYYGGCSEVDRAENLAIDRAKQLYNCGYANVQPHSGSQANSAVYLAMLNKGDTVLAMSLSSGGHLTHGSKVNFSGMLYNFVHYGVNNDGLVDYAEVEKLALQHKPKLIIAGFSAYSRILDWSEFSRISKLIGAKLLVDMSHVSGLVASGHYPSPLPYADVVTSTTHKTLRGPRGGIILAKDLNDFTKKIDKAIFPGTQGGPLMHVIAAKAIAFKEAMSQDFKVYISNVLKNIKVMAAIFKARGYNLVSGGTDNHMLLIDLRNKNVTGKYASELLETYGITVNKNSIPNDIESPFITSGIRIGTSAITTRGFDETDVAKVSTWMCDIIEKKSNIHEIPSQIQNMCDENKIYSK